MSRAKQRSLIRPLLTSHGFKEKVFTSDKTPSNNDVVGTSKPTAGEGYSLI